MGSMLKHNFGETIEGRAYDAGTTVPTNGWTGWAPGCVFVHTDGSGATSLYKNEGSFTSCNFDAITTGIYDGDKEVGTAGSGYDVTFWGDAVGSYLKWDQDANEQGRLIVAEASTRLTCSHQDGQNTGLGNECTLAARQSHNVTTTTGQTQGGRAILGVYTLESTYTNASELSWAGMFGIQGTMTLDGALNGSAVNAFGVSGELRGAGTQVECDEIAPLATFNNNSVNPTTGRKSMIFSANNSGTVDAVLTHQGSATALFDFDDASGFVVEDNQEWGSAAGSLKVVMPSGNAAYINIYDGSAS